MEKMKGGREERGRNGGRYGGIKRGKEGRREGGREGMYFESLF